MRRRALGKAVLRAGHNHHLVVALLLHLEDLLHLQGQRAAHGMVVVADDDAQRQRHGVDVARHADHRRVRSEAAVDQRPDADRLLRGVTGHARAGRVRREEHRVLPAPAEPRRSDLEIVGGEGRRRRAERLHEAEDAWLHHRCAHPDDPGQRDAQRAEDVERLVEERREPARRRHDLVKQRHGYGLHRVTCCSHSWSLNFHVRVRREEGWRENGLPPIKSGT